MRLFRNYFAAGILFVTATASADRPNWRRTATTVHGDVLTANAQRTEGRTFKVLVSFPNEDGGRDTYWRIYDCATWESILDGHRTAVGPDTVNDAILTEYCPRSSELNRRRP